MLSGGYSSSGDIWSAPPAVNSSADPLSAYKRASAQALYHQTVLGAYNTTGESDAWYTASSLAKRPRFDNAINLPIYPQRPGEKDCAHYMQTRTCKFGDTCMFDHPLWVPEGGIPDWKEVPLNVTSETLPERPGAPDCPYFLKTQRCKFGPRCKFNHPQDKIASLAALGSGDVSVLPERPSEPPCAFYTKTGTCKFGATCKFHHPKDIVIPSAGQDNGSGYAGAANNAAGDVATAKPVFSPALLHNSKGLPVRPGETDCPFYLKTGSCKYGATCRYNHPERYAINPPVAPASFVAPTSHFSIGFNPSASYLQTVDPRLTQATLGMGSTIYPQRPGQIACDFYMKSGVCMFGETCKYHHPIDRSMHAQAEAQQQNVNLTLAGLPRREGAINCPYYMKTGACKYGVACRFDHPPAGEVMSTKAEGTSTV
ncbi:zinc finger CCCH domain-containing protein 37-like [Apium graveolens]|uniref:zinc finger CCCH domain-containing protein 37-like n=1 Tax=Apium graveolens TaxID=4045 RepID=UPI003D791384